MARPGPPSPAPSPLAPDPRVAGWALLPLRIFLGFTFCFAGLEKLADPGFFRASNPASIQAQLAAGVRHSPIHGLLSALTHVAVPLGLVMAFAELAVGLGTLLGLYTRVAAVGGMAISFGLFLSVSFHSHPYFTGSDIVFFFAWIPLLLAGPGGAPTLDEYLVTLARSRRPASRPRPGGPVLDRRDFTVRSAAAAGVGFLGLLLGGLAAGVGRLIGGDRGGPATGRLAAGGAGSPTSTTSTTSATATTTRAAAPSTTSTTSSRQTAASGQASHPPGTRLGPARDVPVGGAASFTDPGTGDPALVIQPTAGKFLAFDAVCPHAGCTVQYSQSDRLFICPCHGSEFNGRTGAVEVGPAQQGLNPIEIAEGSDGNLYAR